MHGMTRVTVIDSHTGGEPTRVVVAGGPDLGAGPLADRARRFREHFDPFRSRVVNEPRGSDVLVGALLVEPHAPGCAAGVIFFNNVGTIGMCGHGTIGLVVTLAHLGRVGPGEHRIDTPVGVVSATYHGGARVTVRNVPSYRAAANVAVQVPGHDRPVVGDIAWGGNWFFLVRDAGDLGPLAVGNVARLTAFTSAVRRAVNATPGGELVDHVELFGPPADPANHSRNFVLCPGGAYDRSPCGTGTSAKLACLYADGKLKEGQVWRQESIVGSLFEGTVSIVGDEIIPRIKGAAFITAESDLILDERDPFSTGIR